MSITITRHAYRRSKERLSLNKSAVENLTRKAMRYGLRYRDTEGDIRNYVDSLYGDRNPSQFRIYGDFCFLIANDRLITIFRIPRCFKKLAKEQMDGRQK